MSVSVLDLVADRMSPALDGAAPKIGSEPMWQLVEALLGDELNAAFPGQGWLYMRDLLRALDMPLPRVLVTAWRSYEAFLDLVPEDAPPLSGKVDLVQAEVVGHWELAPRFEGKELSGPRLLVDLKIEIEGATAIVERGCVTGLQAGTLTYSGSVALKGAPEALATVGPKTLSLEDNLLDFGDGFPIRPRFQVSVA